MITKIVFGVGTAILCLGVLLVPFLLQGWLGWELSMGAFFVCFFVAILIFCLFEDYLSKGSDHGAR